MLADELKLFVLDSLVQTEAVFLTQEVTEPHFQVEVIVGLKEGAESMKNAVLNEDVLVERTPGTPAKIITETSSECFEQGQRPYVGTTFVNLLLSDVSQLFAEGS